MTTLHRRNALLQTLVRRWAGTGPAVAGWTREDVDLVWPALVAHHVVPTLGPLIPADLRAPAQAVALEQAALRTQWQLLELERVLPGLQDAGCDPILLKGAALALGAYPEPAERWFIDLDLLVRRDRVEAACGALEAAGYRPYRSRDDWVYYDRHHLHRILVNPHGAVVEVHWDLSIAASPYRFDLEGIVARAREVAVGRQRCRVAAPSDLVVHGVYQDLVDGFVDLRRLLDLVRLMPTLGPADWDAIWTAADAGRMDRALELSLHILKEVVGVESPAGRPAHPLEPWAWRLLDGLDVAAGCLARRSAAEVGYNRFLHLILVPGARRRWRQVGRLLWPRLQPVAGHEPESWQLGLLHCAAAGVRNAVRIARIGGEALRGNPV